MSQNFSPFVVTLNQEQIEKLNRYFQETSFELSSPPHTHFCAKKPGLTCTCYLSGKCTLQGKECQEFIEFYLEPEILQSFSFTHSNVHEDHSHIGVDESGKGDLFGPLCIAGVYVQKEQFALLHERGVKDSKKLSDSTVTKLADFIKRECLYHVVKINPLKYNQIYSEFKNLNTLLAWGHATVIEQMILKSECHDVIIDQFADESVVEKALKRKNVSVSLTQRHKAEEDLAVAAASILARDTYLEGLKLLGKQFGLTLPKGCSSNVVSVGKEIVRLYGKEKLPEMCKMHFKTLDAICGKRGE